MIIIENKDVINTKIIKCSLIRYYMIRKNNEVFKANFDFKIIKSRSKDILNSFYLPDDITISEKGNRFYNFLNIHRIKDEFNFANENDDLIHVNGGTID